jgi:hypothetical protein
MTIPMILNVGKTPLRDVGVRRIRNITWGLGLQNAATPLSELSSHEFHRLADSEFTEYPYDIL